MHLEIELVEDKMARKLFILIFILLVSVYSFAGGPQRQGRQRQGKIVELKISSNDTITVKDGKVTIIHGRDRMSAVYNNYVFREKQFIKKLGDPKKLSFPLVLKINIFKSTEAIEQGDPRGARPQGGFRIITNFCRVIQKIN
jgi:hypothetical protein